MEFKDMIRDLRLELGMTMEELAKLVGVSTPTIQRYESGEIKNVRRDKIKLLADALKVSPAYLMGWEEKQQSDEINTIAAHHDGVEWTKEELEEIEQFKEFVKMRRDQKK